MAKMLFGCGKILTGTHPGLGEGGHCMHYAARMMKDVSAALPSKASVFHSMIKMPSFFEAEELGTIPQPHCEVVRRRSATAKTVHREARCSAGR